MLDEYSLLLFTVSGTGIGIPARVLLRLVGDIYSGMGLCVPLLNVEIAE